MNRIHHIPGGIPNEPLPFTPVQPDWVFWVFFAMFVVFAWVQVFYFRRFQLLVKANFSKRFLHQLIREGNVFNERISITLNLIYVLSIAMVLYQVIRLADHRFSAAIPGFNLFLIAVLSVIGFWSFKIMVMKFLSVVFKTETVNKEYELNILIMTGFLGVVLLPLLLSAIYLKSEWLLGGCICFVIMASVFRFFKGFLIGISLTRFSYFFLFVYLCTLEIIPVLVVAKLIHTYF
ncbi:MAG: DUF4271 domain-containing protein [bacterium]